MKKAASFLSILLLVPLTLTLFPGSVLAAACPDADGDGYITLSTETATLALGDDFDANGNHGASEWQNFFESYQSEAAITPDVNCDNLTFKKGAEPIRCDARLVQSSSGVFDSSKVASVSGNKVYPGAFDVPDNGIDEDCDGADGQFLAGNGGGQDFGTLLDRAMIFLSRAVITISVIILIWGGLLYSTAAGDEQKTAKARKAILGAIIGLVIGLLAPSIVNYLAGLLA